MVGWLGVAKVSGILRHQGVQLILASSWAVGYLTSPGRPTDIGFQLGRACYHVAVKGRGWMFLFCFFTFIPVPLSSLSLSFISSTISSISFIPFSGRRHKMLRGSVGCAVQLETRRSRVQPPRRSVTFSRGDWSWNIFYSHSLPSADSRRAVVSFWQKNVHNTG